MSDTHMSPERLIQIEELYHSALECEPAKRASFLADACGDDSDLLHEVSSLLAQDNSGGPMGKPMAQVAAGLLRDSSKKAITPELEAEPTATILTSGDMLGRYKIESRLGAGGMGEVFSALDTRLGRKVAIKTSLERFTERFEREARAISALNHPYVCTLYDVGPDYLVMELVEGQTLAARLAKGKLSMEDTTRLGSQIAAALAAAHAKGIVHRDLKPANVMLTKTGVKVLDFGVAKSAHEVNLTESRVAIGTPAYMAPEQREGKPCDARSDIYALGLLLREMATGSRDGNTSTLSPNLKHVIDGCLQPDPDERWQSASDVAKELRWAAEAPPVNTSPSRRRFRLIWPLTTGVAIVALAAWAIAMRDTPARAEAFKLELYPPPGTHFTGAVNSTVPAPQFALSPDGRAIIFAAAATDGQPTLWRRTLGELSAHQLNGTEGAEDPFWSPDGQWIGFFANGKLKKAPTTGGPAQTIADGLLDSRGGSWGPADTIVLSPAAGAIYQVPSGGGELKPVTKLNTGGHRWPQFLPDGRHFIYTVYSPTAERRGGWIADLAGNASIPLGVFSPCYAEPGYLLWVDGGILLGRKFDSGRMALEGQPFTVAENVGLATRGNSAVSAGGGNLAYAPASVRSGRLTWFDRGGRELDRGPSEGEYVDFRISPDRRRLAFSRFDPNSGSVNIWSMDLDRGTTSLETFGSGVSIVTSAAFWSRDGSELLYRSNHNGAMEIYRKAAGGKIEEVVLPAATARATGLAPVALVPTDLSPDGRQILISARSLQGYDLWLAPLSGSGPPTRYIDSPLDQIHGQFSPDGKLIAYTSNESGKYEVYVQTFPLSNRKWAISNSGGYEPRWRGDGHEIYYLSEDRKLMAVPVRPGPTFERPFALFQTQVRAGVSALRTHYAADNDGRRFLVNTQVGDESSKPITIELNWAAGLKK